MPIKLLSGDDREKKYQRIITVDSVVLPDNQIRVLGKFADPLHTILMHLLLREDPQSGQQIIVNEPGTPELFFGSAPFRSCEKANKNLLTYVVEKSLDEVVQRKLLNDCTEQMTGCSHAHEILAAIRFAITQQIIRLIFSIQAVMLDKEKDRIQVNVNIGEIDVCSLIFETSEKAVWIVELDKFMVQKKSVLNIFKNRRNEKGQLSRSDIFQAINAGGLLKDLQKRMKELMLLAITGQKFLKAYGSFEDGELARLVMPFDDLRKNAWPSPYMRRISMGYARCAGYGKI